MVDRAVRGRKVSATIFTFKEKKLGVCLLCVFDAGCLSQAGSTLEKIEAVKITMQGSIAQALNNCARIEDLQTSSAELTEAAGMFKSQAKSLKDEMWWGIGTKRSNPAFVLHTS
jgi:hypothetical protein